MRRMRMQIQQQVSLLCRRGIDLSALTNLSALTDLSVVKGLTVVTKLSALKDPSVQRDLEAKENV